MTKDFIKKVSALQAELKAPKGQFNSFGKYNYRSCEDILEAVKPLTLKHGLLIHITDEVMFVEGRHYIKATAIITDGDSVLDSTAYAREEETKKGMDGSQVTGASSSYARKYALNGLLMIDDTKDSDATNVGESKPAPATIKKTSVAQDKQTLEEAMKQLEASSSVDELKNHWFANTQYQKVEEYKAMCSKRKAELSKKAVA